MSPGLFVFALSFVFAVSPTEAPGVTLSATTVDAVGDQSAVLKLDKSGMVRIQVESPTGTACTVVDHLRGPFLQDGIVGKESCDVDVLLDAGVYKLRLTSPVPSSTKNSASARAPQATLKAALFSDVDPPLVLSPGRSSTLVLPSGKQVTRWLRVPTRQEIVVDVAGRTAGRVALWRDGAWVEDAAPESSVERPLAGRPIHHHQLSAVVDPGDYALVVYGTAPQPFSASADDDTIFIAWDAPPASPTRTETLVVPVWGFVAVKAPVGSIAAFMTVEGARTKDVTLTANPVVGGGEWPRRSNGTTSCTVSPTNSSPSCALTSGSAGDLANVLTVQGPPGTVARIVWAPLGSGVNGGFAAARDDVMFSLDAPAERLAVTGLPAGVDDAPVGCVLEKLDEKNRFAGLVARDMPSVGWTQAWKRSFNTDATTQAVWLHIEKPGLYGITGDDKTGASCEVFRLQDDGTTTRVGEGKEGTCAHKLPLPAGPIEVRFYGGRPGIQTLRVGQVGVAALVGDDREAPPRSGCLFQDLPGGALAAGRYRVRTSGTGGATVRGVFAFQGGVDDRAVVVPVDPARPVRVPLKAGAEVVVRSVGGVALTCTIDDKPLPGCMTGVLSQAASLVIQHGDARDGRPAVALVTRPTPPPSQPPLNPWAGAPPRLPVVEEGHTAWFDLDGTTARSFIVRVASAGLYDIATEGLLATSCAVRTATSTSLYSGDRNGRGRNCLVSSYLKPGNYLVTVRAEGRSKGHGGLRLTARPAWDGGALVLGDERFVKVEAGALARHVFTLKKDMHVQGGVTAQAAELSCRLDDDDGWPVKPVPHDCELSGERLAAGRYTLNVLPLTVESRRALRLGEPQPQEPLTGEKVHTIGLNTTYDARLSEDGKDLFRFVLAGDVDVGVVLSPGMQGRLYRATGDKGLDKGEVFEAIPPVGGGTLALGGDSPVEDEEGDSEDEASDEEASDADEPEPSEEYGETEGEGDDDGETGDGEDEGVAAFSSRSKRGSAASAAELTRATVHKAPPPLRGHVLRLPAGTWLLETESSRGDVFVGYTVRVDVRTLLPGAVLDVAAPAVIDVGAPARADAGLVRIRTRGSTDVACRLFDAAGTLVGESQESGADWNCALAVPLSTGAGYKLFVDAEVLQPGPTTVIAEFLEARDTGALKDGDAFKLVGKVAQATVSPQKGAVTDVTLTAVDEGRAAADGNPIGARPKGGEFSCAVFDVDGALLDRQVGVRMCSLLLWGADDDRPFKVLAWTADRPASVKASVSVRPVQALAGPFSSGGNLDDKVVAAAAVTARGRFETAPNARCLQKKKRGALVPCPVAASFDPAQDGDTVLVGVARGEKARVEFREVVAELDKPGSDERVLVGRPTVERQRSQKKALHLVDVRSLPGSTSSPACALEGGARMLLDARCVAATGPRQDSVLSTWTRPGGRLRARLLRRAVPLPQTTPLALGTSKVTRTSRSALPAEPFRLELSLPADAWAVLLDDSERAVDVCAPAVEDEPRTRAPLSRCVLRGRGGSVVIVGDGDEPFDVRADLLRFSAIDEPARVLLGVREVRPRAPGREHLRFSAEAYPRALRVEGGGVRACAIHLDDGARVPACAATIPAGRGAEITVEHDARAWRASLGKVGDFYGARFGALPRTSAHALEAGRADVLTGLVVERTAVAPGPGVLRLRATGGVCGVARGEALLGAAGLGGGCDLRVIVDGGPHRLLVRGFGGAPLSGTVAWTFEPITPLSEGVGPETLVQPGEARVFRLDLKTDGELGIGLQVDSEVLDCALLNAKQEIVGEGCQQFGRFGKGTYWLRVEAAPDVAPRRFRPVVFGLKGADIDVPDDWLRDFFRRVPPPSAVQEVR